MKYVILSMLLVFASTSLGAETTTKSTEKVQLKWVLEHQPVKYFKIAAEKFRDVAQKESKGQIEVLIEERSNKDFPNYGLRQLRRDAPQRLLKGEINLAQIYTTNLTQFAPELEVMSIPYLFENHDHVAQVIEGSIGEELLAKASTKGYRTLAFTYSGGFENIVTRKDKPLNTLKDFSSLTNKNYSPVTLKALNALNKEYKVTNENDIENFMTGKIDTLSLTYTDIDGFLHKKVEANYYPTEHNVLFTAVTMSEKLYASLPENLKAIVKTAAIEAARAERVAIITDGDDGLKKLSAASFIKAMDAKSPFANELRAKLNHAEKQLSPEVQAYAKRIRALSPKSGKKLSMNH